MPVAAFFSGALEGADATTEATPGLIFPLESLDSAAFEDGSVGVFPLAGAFDFTSLALEGTVAVAGADLLAPLLLALLLLALAAAFAAFLAIGASIDNPAEGPCPASSVLESLLLSLVLSTFTGEAGVAEGLS